MLVRGNKGFTLIELLIVIAIIVILAAVLIPNLLGARARAQITSAVAEMRSIATGMETWSLDRGSYPADGDLGNFTAQYLGNKTPRVPWNRTADILTADAYNQTLDGQGYLLVLPIPTGLRPAAVLQSGVANATAIRLTHEQGVEFIP